MKRASGERSRWRTAVPAVAMLAVLASLAPVGSARAAQSAGVVHERESVHQFPNPTSPVVGEVSRDDRIQVSSESVRDVFGNLWHKTTLPEGGYGYIRAAGIRTDELVSTQRSAGVQMTASNRMPRERPWLFGIRGALLGGWTVAGAPPVLGAEGEISVNVPLSEHGYLRRLLAIGASYSMLDPVTVIGGSAIFRVFTRTRVEPEFRLRAGMAAHPRIEGGSGLAAGLSLAFRYPFSLDGGPHFSAYFDAGGMTRPSAEGPAWYFSGAGLGFHF